MTRSEGEAAPLPFDNSYARLPERFYARRPPAVVAAPRLIRLNELLAEQLGFDPGWLRTADGVAMLAGNRWPTGADPIAQAYAGHQFGHFVPQLGDGRALLLGEVIDRGGQRRDIQLKGSGPTPFSRRGDGRAALGPVLREYIVSEAFAALGIPTTRALAATLTGEEVWRDRPLPGAVLTRVAASHIRVGTFQYFAARGDVSALRLLADHAVARHYAGAADAPQTYRALLDQVVGRQARLIAQWLLIGFIHGVMNTDNMSIAGETIDFGPCAFMDRFDPGAVFSSIDHAGRYAYANQPRIAQWNLARFAETLLPLLDEEEDAAVTSAQEALAGFGPAFKAAYEEGLCGKIGLRRVAAGDLELGQDLLQCMAEAKADFTGTFRALCDAADDADGIAAARALFADAAQFDAWSTRWHQRLRLEGEDARERRARMRGANPAFIPRNHAIERVIGAAVERGDFDLFHRMVDVLQRPFEDQPDAMAEFGTPPRPDEVVRATFCGT